METVKTIDPPKDIEDISVPVDVYFASLYPLEKGEIKRKVVHLWNNYYRINMWGDSHIIRSFFIKAWKEKGMWHSVILPE